MSYYNYGGELVPDHAGYLHGINHRLNYKGEIDHDTIAALTTSGTAQKWDCYLYNGNLYEAYGDIIRKGDYCYWDGIIWRAIAPPAPVPRQRQYDVVIVGGGAAGIGAAYALRDSGLAVCIVDRNDHLGGTHTQGGVIQQLATPVPSWYKDIISDAMDAGMGRWDSSKFAPGEGSAFDKNWRGSLVSTSKNNANGGNAYTINPIWLERRYHDDLAPTIDILTGATVQEVHVTQQSKTNRRITAIDITTGEGRWTINGKVFVDASGDAVLTTLTGELGKDYLFGSDAKTAFNEPSLPDGYAGAQDELNPAEQTYLKFGVTSAVTAFFGDVTKFGETEYLSDGTIKGQNNNWAWPQVGGTVFAGVNTTPVTVNVMSPDGNTNIAASVMLGGYDAARALGYNNAIAHNAHYNVVNGWMRPCAMLAIRESFRPVCDTMVTENEIGVRCTAANLGDAIAVSSWYCDIHPFADVAHANSITSRTVTTVPDIVYGIPYGALIPKAFNNVLCAGRCIGASHIGASAVRLIKTCISTGYAAGHAARLALSSHVGDVRNVPAAYIQAAVGLPELLGEIEEYWPVAAE